MRFAYEDLSSKQFEGLVILLCQHLLGMGVQQFADGQDGGRDAKFIGTAQLHPSTVDPWRGTVIIQAKHTNGYNRNFNESDFFSTTSSNTVIGKETPRIKNLRAGGQLDHYMLFANRRLPAKIEDAIQQHIATACALPLGSIYLFGLEQLELMLLRFPEVPGLAKLDPIDSPLIVSPDELADFVHAFTEQSDAIIAGVEDAPVKRVSYSDKNRINDMSPQYASEIRKRYLKDTATIQAFLAAPENAELLEQYNGITEEFQLKVISKRQQYSSFDEVMEYLVDLLFARSPLLSKNRRLTRAILFFMYWNCDLGETQDAPTN